MMWCPYWDLHVKSCPFWIMLSAKIGHFQFCRGQRSRPPKIDTNETIHWREVGIVPWELFWRENDTQIKVTTGGKWHQRGFCPRDQWTVHSKNKIASSRDRRPQVTRIATHHQQEYHLFLKTQKAADYFWHSRPITIPEKCACCIISDDPRQFSNHQ